MRATTVLRLVFLIWFCRTHDGMGAQQLDTELLEAVRRGAESSELRATPAISKLIGKRNLPLVEVKLNGKGPYRLLIDLGSNVVIFRKSVAVEANAEILVDRPTSDILRLDSVEIGAAVFRNVHGAAYDELDVDGVIGYNLLRAFPFSLDYPGMTLTMGVASLPEPDGREVFDYLVEGRLPYLRVPIGSDTILFNFDTGATEWLTMPAAWADRFSFVAPPDAGPITSNNQTGDARVHVARLAEPLRFGSHTIRRPLVFFNPDADDAWFGSALLQHFAITFDPAQNRVRIERASSDPLDIPPYCVAGIRISQKAGTHRVIDVVPGTPAHVAGAQIGDIVSQVVVTRIGEVINPARLAASIRCGDTIELQAERNGRTLEFRFLAAELGG